MHSWFESDPVKRAGLGSFSGDSTWAGISISFKQKLYVLFLGMTSAVVLVSRNVQRSRTGRAMMAVRDRDTTAAVIGVGPGTNQVYRLRSVVVPRGYCRRHVCIFTSHDFPRCNNG